MRVRLVLVEVRARPVELAEGDERLDRVGPEGKRGVVHAAVEEPPGELAKVGGRRLHVSERELEPAEHSERDDAEERVGGCLREREAFLRRSARLVDETEI